MSLSLSLLKIHLFIKKIFFLIQNKKYLYKMTLLQLCLAVTKWVKMTLWKNIHDNQPSYGFNYRFKKSINEIKYIHMHVVSKLQDLTIGVNGGVKIIVICFLLLAVRKFYYLTTTMVTMDVSIQNKNRTLQSSLKHSTW